MPKRTLLCVDDEPETLRVRRALLESKGYLVLTASSGQEALNLLSENHIDLLLLDYRMPGMNGDELAEVVIDKFPSLPVIAISGVEDLPQRLLNNVEARVSKASDPELLLSAVSATLGEEEGAS